MAERLEPALRDDDPLVRASAIRLQRLAPKPVRRARLVGLLGDPVRTVRIAAARALLDHTSAQMPSKGIRALRSAMGEWRASLNATLDFPETHLKLGGIALTMRDLRSAEAAFREVVRMDPQRSEGWIMLARIAGTTGGPEAARDTLREGLRVSPDDAALRGLLAEMESSPRAQ
jgi:predicted Zn-dependent protease